MNGLHTFVINLDRSPERLEQIGRSLDALALPWTRVPAVDGRLLPEAERRAALDEHAYRRQHGMSPVPGELGCYLSHVGAMRRFLGSDAALALILEDDVRPRAALPRVLQALQDCAAHWDMVKISGVHSGTPIRVRPLVDDHWLAVMLTKCTGSSAYLINREAARAYLDRLLPMTLPYDHVFDQGWRFGLRVRMVTPWPAHHDDQVPTTIDSTAAGTARTSRKFHWSRRLPTHWSRARNELRRVRYALGEVWRERLAR